MVAPRPILKSLPLYTPDTMKHTRITRFARSDSDPDTDGHCNDNDNEDEDEHEQKQAEGPATPASPALPFASATHIPPFSPHVHFPPTPILTQMAMTHSSVSYDRKPIKVQPNELALPARGEREVASDSDVESDVGTDAGIRAGSGSGSISGARRNAGNEYDQGYFQLPTRSYDAEVMDSMDMDVDHSTDRGSHEQPYSFGTSSPRNSSRRSSPKASPPAPRKLRCQTPYHQTSALPFERDELQHASSRLFPPPPPPPPLVFDPSSESDSDLCISPGNGGQSPDQVSHMSQISLHLAGFASKLALDDDDGAVSACTNVPASPLLARKRADDRRSPSRAGSGAPSDGLAKRRLKSKGARIVGGSDAGYRTSTKSSAFAGSRFGSSFYEGGLDGCLGGF